LRENQKYIQVRRGYQSDQKIAKDWLRRIKNTKIKIWQYIFDWWKSVLAKKIQFEEEKFKIECLRTQLDFVEGLIEFMEGLIVRKFWFFNVNLGFN